ncbi:ladderlectin isoform X2 [Lates calcarifer]|nr:ladderlectin isoform X2 [Lates calcarifer]
MRIIFLVCAAFALSVATEEKPDESLAPMTEKFEKEDPAPVLEAGDQTPGDVRQSKNSCLSGWLKYGSRCFIFVNRQMAWIDAERYCLRNGANLASIHNPGEYRFLQDMIRTSTGRFAQTWIGANDAIKDQAWFWSDGSNFLFHSWGVGEPNNADGHERCIEMNRSKDHLWNDLPFCVYKVLFTLQLCRPCRHSAERLHSSEADVQLLTVNNEDCSFSLCCLRSELCRRASGGCSCCSGGASRSTS